MHRSPVVGSRHALLDSKQAALSQHPLDSSSGAAFCRCASPSPAQASQFSGQTTPPAPSARARRCAPGQRAARRAAPDARARLRQRAARGQAHAEQRAVVAHAHRALPVRQRQRGQPARPRRPAASPRAAWRAAHPGWLPGRPWPAGGRPCWRPARRGAGTLHVLPPLRLPVTRAEPSERAASRSRPGKDRGRRTGQQAPSARGCRRAACPGGRAGRRRVAGGHLGRCWSRAPRSRCAGRCRSASARTCSPARRSSASSRSSLAGSPSKLRGRAPRLAAERWGLPRGEEAGAACIKRLRATGRRRTTVTACSGKLGDALTVWCSARSSAQQPARLTWTAGCPGASRPFFVLRQPARRAGRQAGARSAGLRTLPAPPRGSAPSTCASRSRPPPAQGVRPAAPVRAGQQPVGSRRRRERAPAPPGSSVRARAAANSSHRTAAAGQRRRWCRARRQPCRSPCLQANQGERPGGGADWHGQLQGHAGAQQAEHVRRAGRRQRVEHTRRSLTGGSHGPDAHLLRGAWHEPSGSRQVRRPERVSEEPLATCRGKSCVIGAALLLHDAAQRGSCLEED